MQSASPIRRWLVFLLATAVFVVGGAQVAHWDSTHAYGKHTVEQGAQSTDGLCPICYSVPVGHGAAPAVFLPVGVQTTLHDVALAAQDEGVQPEFHLHIRPPPALA